MSVNDTQIGPGTTCFACGEGYGQHAPDCSRAGAQPTKMQGVRVSEADAVMEIYLPVLRARYGDGISFFDGIGKLFDEVSGEKRA